MNDTANYIENIINRDSWVVGGQNFDEDIHFSSFYLRLSSKKYLRKRAKIGYHTIIAVYQNFNETYYIPISDCERVARDLLEKVKKQPDLMNTIVAKIYHRCAELTTVFANYDIRSDFSALSLEQIKKLYRKHFAAHWKLYEVARIPEALDRGSEMFSGYLKSYLRRQCKTQDRLEINELFYKLTMPVKPSIFQEEFFEFLEIVESIENILGQKDLFQNLDRRLFLKVEPSILRKIDAHRERWGFLEYHGYGYRKIPDLDHYIGRISAYLKHSVKWKNREEYTELTKTFKDEQITLYSKYKIDQKHQKIFALYSTIGLAKLFRRFVQLRNFYFLDKLIHQIALRTGHEEGIIRCLLPEEIEDLMNGRLNIDETIRNRMEFIVYLIDGEEEKVISGVKHKWIKETLDAKVKSPNLNANELYGTPASLGYVEGICKTIIRPQDAINKGFKDGEIIVSESTDPDLADLIARAGGVITQQGGVTSHASIICRELGKPALVSVRNLLDNVGDYDEIILDAYTGKIVIVRKGRENKVIIKSDEISPQLLDRTGNKAFKLGMLKKAGFAIPQFFVVPTDLFRKYVDNGILNVQKLAASQDLIDEINRVYNGFATKRCVIRSSYLVEDDKSNSKAGHFATLIDIEIRNIYKEFEKYVIELHKKFRMIPKGGIIIQEMISGEISGVCFTVDPLSTDRNILIIEVVRGLNFRLTDGTATPDIRIKIAKDSGDILATGSYIDENLIVGLQIPDLVKNFIEIERYFGHPQDIEWTIRGGKIFILQSRPITTL
ncbi:MAG: hypothetical protein IMF19_07675 [Proteobacteria bacterium]|nr:hypothetical protein [Pseudomonadota bacterium]